MSARDEVPFDGKPRTQNEWNMYLDWRLARIEETVKNLVRAVVTVIGGIIVGVVLWLITQGGPPGAS